VAKTAGVKRSFILPTDLDEMMHRACKLHRLKPSDLIRQLIIAGIDAWLNTKPPRVVATTLGEPGTAPIQLDRGIRSAVRIACELLGMDESALLSVVLRDHLSAYIRQGKEKRDKLALLLAELEAAPEPPGPGEGTAEEAVRNVDT
jgi:hypothetical protein